MASLCTLAPPSRGRVCERSKGLVCFFKVDGECFGRAVLQHDGDDAGQDGHVGAVAASVVHLADVTPASRARAAWETSAWIRSVANAVARMKGMSPYRTEFYARDVFGLFGVRTFGPGASR